MTDLLSGLSRVKRELVIREATRLLSSLGSNKADAKTVEEALAARRIFLPERGPENGLDHVPIGDYPLAAMLLARPHQTRPRVNELNHLRAWALVATLQFCTETGESDRHSRAAAGLRVVRRITGNKYPTDMLGDFTPFDNSLSALDATLTKAAENYAARNPLALNKIELLQRLIDCAEIVQDPIARGRVSSHDLGQWMPDLSVDETEDVTTVFDSVNTDPEASAEEQAEDRELLYYRFTELLPPALRGKELVARQISLFEEEERERGWSGDFAALSGQEARAIWERAVASDHPGASVALASLMCGRSVTELNCQPILGSSWWEDGGIGFAPDVPLSTGKSLARNRFVMMPPPDLRHRFMAVPGAGDRQEHLKTWLSTLDMGRPLGPSHLVRALRDGMPREDPAVIGLLTGRSVTDVVQMYYTQVRVTQLQEVWAKALESRFGADLAVEITSPKAKVGTLKAPSYPQVKTYFEELVSLAATPERHRHLELKGKVQHFADLSNFCATALSFVTARRPHGYAFEPFEQIIGHRRPRLFLTGKGGRLVDDGRWVPICPTAAHIIRLWRAHCDGLAKTGLAALLRLGQCDFSPLPLEGRSTLGTGGVARTTWPGQSVQLGTAAAHGIPSHPLAP